LAKELQQIIEKLNTFGSGEKAILATVVDVVGSGYRRPGARMLIDRNGFGIGTVSGGCLEADVLERAKKVLESNEPAVITYDTTKDEGSVFGLGMGCRGIVRILLEPVEKESEFVEFLSICLNRRQTARVATLINPGKVDLKVGLRIFEEELNAFGHQLSRDEFLEVKNIPEYGSTVEQLSFGEVFVETINPPLNLLLFGAGYDALPLIKFAKELGWRVTAVDHRPAFANKARLPDADEIMKASIEELDDRFFEDENSVAVVMTHNYDRDRTILPRLLKSKCLYVGALGPKKRTEKILAETGAEWTGNLYAPIGLDIGAGTPEAIALSIVAEIQAVFSNRKAGFLRDRQGSIYGRS
jgi:xanthine dehydrogenase accessory factor